MKALIEVIASLSFAKRYDFGPIIGIDFEIESPADSYIQEINATKDLAFRERIGLATLLSWYLHPVGLYEKKLYFLT